MNLKDSGFSFLSQEIMAIPILLLPLLLLVALVSSQEFDHDWNSLDAGLTREEIGRKTANIEPQSSD